MNVPLLDLKSQYTAIKQDIQVVLEKVCAEQSFILGAQVQSLEENLASYIGTDHAIGVASGSDALLLSLMEVGVQPGDRVVTVPFTFFASAGVISRLHARPVFVDVTPDTFNLDPIRLADSLASDVKAILPVHLFGQCADMETILQIADAQEIPVIEDACQAIGAARNGVRAGAFGRTGGFSFFPSKNLGGFGDGGLITTRDPLVAERLRLLRVHGSRSEYHHHLIGINSRLDALQAAILQVKFQHLAEWTAKRQAHAATYQQMFQTYGLDEHVTVPIVASGNSHVYNQFTVRTRQRDELSAYLTHHGIGNRIYYPVPLHLQECYQDLGYHKGDFPVSEQLSQEVLSLPIYPELTQDQLQYVVDTINAFFHK
ncbi:DegT/DnrJ/EryC1/StrS family aminotransferase [Candidatus Nitrospira neomarina]|uniref:DegT/DnrJ/EryC1/StrS family aminotransferase n=1 Tax=Candidatus Nitrospira neomarina TaxID=3020899 RepID=A0AA96GHC2_9BACT|nr:DegT/DnrJ/EryC1/StrS family aminotransferase [Candidatus Nitrospira neomarina]WNM61911.1 DegT/DnrJ/EryC1/StrS family aminotransferase [Candidatus Nitrospira neomarina]